MSELKTKDDFDVRTLFKLTLKLTQKLPLG